MSVLPERREASHRPEHAGQRTRLRERDTAGAGAGDTKDTSGEWRESGHPPSVNSYLSRPYIISL